MRPSLETAQAKGDLEEHVLIVDDDAVNRAILDQIFSPFYSIDEAENGRIGLEKILKEPNRYSAILLDAMMPEMNGLEVLEALQREGLNEKIPVFLITAEASDSVMRDAYRMGVMDVISKPVIPYVVQRRVNSVMELFRARKQLSSRVENQTYELLEKEHRISSLTRACSRPWPPPLSSVTVRAANTSTESMTSPASC